MNLSSKYLFSIDLEDIRDRFPEGERYANRVPETTELFLKFLAKHDKRATFFVEGRVADRHPELIAKIADAGHELACHTQTHPALDQISKEELKEELEKNIEGLINCGATKVSGFRAPCFSLTRESSWAYETLAELGFSYSSSVLPAKNPLYGWPEFGKTIKEVSGITEIPMSVLNFKPLPVPFGGGVYFRVFPAWLLKQIFKRHLESNTSLITGYFHPYDIDQQQERFSFPGMEDKPIFNQLMYWGRGSVFKKLELIMQLGFDIIRYDEFVLNLKPATTEIKQQRALL